MNLSLLLGIFLALIYYAAGKRCDELDEELDDKLQQVYSIAPSSRATRKCKVPIEDCSSHNKNAVKSALECLNELHQKLIGGRRKRWRT